MKCVLISDFNTDNLAALMRNSDAAPVLEPLQAPYGQVYQTLLDQNAEVWAPDLDACLVWTRPESVIKSFQNVLLYEDYDLEVLLDEVDQFSQALIQAASRCASLLVASWCVPDYLRNYRLMAYKSGQGEAQALLAMNRRLADNLQDTPNIFMLNSQAWFSKVGQSAHDPRMWYLAKIPYSRDLFAAALAEVQKCLGALKGQAKKLLVLDLDNTLWGGIVGDDGWENLVLGGHDPRGEALKDFQTALKALTRRGILLAIVSKNEEHIAMEAIDKHPEMVLGKDDFVGWRINWNDKAQNISDLVSGLNLGLQSVVFIDDNPVERARVRDMLPEVMVPEWPQDMLEYPRALAGLGCFDAPSVSKEDLARTAMYKSEARRDQLKNQIGSMDDWVKTLDIKVVVSRITEANLERTSQLFNKTNQMNLTTRRFTQKELVDWAAQEGHELWTYHVSDKFGDSGLTGIIGLELNGAECTVSDFILSCRIMGRKVEDVILATMTEFAKSRGAQKLMVHYLPTPKNMPCLRFWQATGLEEESENTFVWHLNEAFPRPGGIELLGFEEIVKAG